MNFLLYAPQSLNMCSTTRPTRAVENTTKALQRSPIFSASTGSTTHLLHLFRPPLPHFQHEVLLLPRRPFPWPLRRWQPRTIPRHRSCHPGYRPQYLCRSPHPLRTVPNARRGGCWAHAHPSCDYCLIGASRPIADLERRTPSRRAHRCAQHRDHPALYQRPRRHGRQRRGSRKPHQRDPRCELPPILPFLVTLTRYSPGCQYRPQQARPQARPRRTAHPCRCGRFGPARQSGRFPCF
ncbi:hypothetical protein DFH08DRAFT_412031 [Mycena albidolilacea]|uniref:Uncharacterized protein n=1 Tax=Mycena albidolilacea TaxID=1033008 RepID=A0AAD7AI59_9AGAR|nr:hypothetical protein DFH08DRAFT_412031 [Mycena albidolilacea]